MPFGTAKSDEAIDSFARAAGFLPIDPHYFWSPAWNGPHRFPDYDRESILVADALLGDAGKAVLAIDALDGPLPHVRYLVTSREVMQDEDRRSPYRFVEITRFNLGPTLIADVAASYAGQFTPSAPHGVPAPHVTWRFVFDSDKYMASIPLAIGRGIMGADAAAEADCFGLPCLSLSDPLGRDWVWTDIMVDEAAYPAIYPETDTAGVTVPARIAALLRHTEEWQGPYEMVISTGVVGQENTANGIVRYHPFYVDEVSSDWLVRREVAGLAPVWGQIRSAGLPGDAFWTAGDDIDRTQLDWRHIQTEGLPTWRMTTRFMTDGHPPVTYQTVANGEVATHQSDHWLYIGLDNVAGGILARNPVGGIALPILHYDPYVHEYIGWNDVPNRIAETSRSIDFGPHIAQEYTLFHNQPAIVRDDYRVWTGTFWAVADLPAGSGWYGLPGSPFAGRSGIFRMTWHDLGRDLAPYGLVVRADITLHDGLTGGDLRAAIAAGQGLPDLSGIARNQQRATMQVSDLVADDSGTLSRTFPDLAPIGAEIWPYDLPVQLIKNFN